MFVRFLPAPNTALRLAGLLFIAGTGFLVASCTSTEILRLDQGPAVAVPDDALFPEQTPPLTVPEPAETDMAWEQVLPVDDKGHLTSLKNLPAP